MCDRKHAVHGGSLQDGNGSQEYNGNIFPRNCLGQIVVFVMTTPTYTCSRSVREANRISGLSSQLLYWIMSFDCESLFVDFFALRGGSRMNSCLHEPKLNSLWYYGYFSVNFNISLTVTVIDDTVSSKAILELLLTKLSYPIVFLPSMSCLWTELVFSF